MEVLSRLFHRLQFAWQASVFQQPWLIGLLVIVLVLTGMLGQAWWSQQHWQQALRTLPVHAHSGRSMPLPGANAKAQPSVASLTLRQWPAEEEADRISAEILVLADAMGMVFERAEFQSASTEHSELHVQRIKLPLSGDYLQLRHFLTLVLQRYPSLALNQCKLKRSDVQQVGLDAYIEFSLYTRKRGQT